MKSKWLLVGILFSFGILVGCGGSSGGGGDQTCEVDLDCSDDVCNDCNECTDEVCVGALNNCRSDCNATGVADPCCADPACSGDPNCGFTGGSFLFHVVQLAQQPSSCLVAQVLLNLIMPIIGDTFYPVELPGTYPNDIELPIPLFGPITVHARMVNGELEFDEVEIQNVDLSTLNIPGLNCVVGGKADGMTQGLSPQGMDVIINIYDMSVSLGGGEGACNLPQPPAQNCTLTATSEGEPN